MNSSELLLQNNQDKYVEQSYNSIYTQIGQLQVRVFELGQEIKANLLNQQKRLHLILEWCYLEKQIEDLKHQCSLSNKIDCFEQQALINMLKALSLRQQQLTWEFNTLPMEKHNDKSNDSDHSKCCKII